MIQIHITTGTIQDELDMAPLSVAERAAIWYAFQKLAAYGMQPNGKSRYTLGLQFLGKTFHSCCIWERVSDYTNPVEEQRLVVSAWPEDILKEDRWTEVILRDIPKET